MEKVDKRTGEIRDTSKCQYNERGEEILDDTPVALPVGFKRPQSLQERMRYLLRAEFLKRDLEAHGVETFEEADDFSVDEQDPLEGTPYEDQFEPDIPGIAAREQEIRAGAVLDRPKEKKEKASETIRNFRRSKSGNKRKHSSVESRSTRKSVERESNRSGLSARDEGGDERDKETNEVDSDGDEL